MQVLGPLVVLRGGWASSLYTFTIQRAESRDDCPTTLVLKLYAPSARGYEHARREWCALTHLGDANYPVPKIMLFESDVRHLGYPFVVMGHIQGNSFWDVYRAADLPTQAQLTQLFVAQLVELHAFDPHLLEPASVLANPYGYIGQELEQLRRDSADSPHVMLTETVRWLEQRKNSILCERSVILHRDYHPWNVLADATERLWVIDWDWKIGDPRFDLAWTCMLMNRSGFYDFSSAVRYEYARQTGRSFDDLAYFEVLATIRWLLNVLPSVNLDADFRAFVVGPVRKAEQFLQESTGVNLDIRM